MSLDKLTRHVLLDRGQADLVHNALYLVYHELIHREAGGRWSTVEALSLKVIQRQLGSLLKLAKRDDLPLKPPPEPKPGRKARPLRPPKPHRLRQEFDELATIRHYYARLLATATQPGHHAMLATALARFHQPSLALESYIKLPPPTGPGAQTNCL